jgi:TonB family protein
MSGNFPNNQSKKKAPLPLMIAGVILLLGIVAFFVFRNGDDDGGAPSPRNEIKMISLPPPPPPPPPPKQEPPKPEEPKFQKEDAPSEEKPPDKAPEPEAAPISTSIQGNDASGLAAGNGGGMGGNGFGGKGGGGGSKYGWYAGKVQARVADALRTHKKTRSAIMSVQVRVWADNTGRISKVSLAQSTGNPELDAAIKNEVLANVVLSEPPPQGMPMPIVMKFNARRPN